MLKMLKLTLYATSETIYLNPYSILAVIQHANNCEVVCSREDTFTVEETAESIQAILDKDTP